LNFVFRSTAAIAGAGRWGGPLGRMLDRILTEDLVQRLPDAAVFVESGAISTRPDTVVEIDTQRLDAELGGTMVLLAQIAVRPDGKPARALRTRLTTPIGGIGSAFHVAAMSTIIAQLADRIAALLVRGGSTDRPVLPGWAGLHIRERLMPMLRRALLAAILPGLAILGTALPTAAQAPQIRLRATIVSLDGPMLTVETREGPTAKLTLPEGFNPTALKRLSMDEIKPNSYVATVAAPAADRTLQSVYVAVFSEAQRGVGEGHYDWDLAPGTSMTNATVTSAVQATAGRKLTMVYKGTPIDVVVPADAPIIQTVPASRDDLKPGAKIFAVVSKTGDNAYTAIRLTVSKDGVDPPQ
jgi:hypothetical protein